ncbi:MAG: hypothetical protein BroJett029_10450 [Alphaproteobacteria bacterium]|nr:MAG: hypothetical protein BroJett029_10450 [Alphaproteobacteria bacterium]
MRLKALLVAVALAVGLASCADRGQNESIGMVLGGVLGAVAGSQVGDGTGQVVATAAGTLLGAWLGGSIGRSLDEKDRQTAYQTDQEALENNEDGESSSWSNPDTGASGSTTPTDSFQTAQGTCRTYEKTIINDGKAEQTTGKACRNSDGLWVEVN